MLTKTVSVLRRNLAAPASVAHVQFVSDHEPGGRPRMVHHLDADAWDDMGRPETVTVTVEPGDRLND